MKRRATCPTSLTLANNVAVAPNRAPGLSGSATLARSSSGASRPTSRVVRPICQPSEASQFGKPVIMGPHSEKCNAQIKDLVWSGGAIQIEKGPKMNENFLNNIFELISNKERLEDMGKNSLIASGYAQQRADEASIHLLELLNKSNKQDVA